VLAVFIPIATVNAFLIPVAAAFMADLVPPERRGMCMATLRRGWLLVNYRGDVGGGPGMGFLLTLPVIMGSLLGGYIFKLNQATPWLLQGSALALNALLAVIFLESRGERK
jgi:predicted MFS family arabinose efflux permease